jgi:excisionase family DNA binding protein
MSAPQLQWPALMTPEQASAFLQVPVSTLSVWRSTGRVALPYLKVGGHVRYRFEDIERFLAEHSISSKPRGEGKQWDTGMKRLSSR